MSFDVFFQRFSDGEADDGGGDAMRRVLKSHIAREDPALNLAVIELGDGSADVYLDDSSMMANHISGAETWDVLVDGARAADWVIMPVGCPTCITRESQRAHLPEGLDEDIVLVASGAELLTVIEDA